MDKSFRCISIYGSGTPQLHEQNNVHKIEKEYNSPSYSSQQKSS